MVERDPEVQHAFKGGYAEVVLIWYCEKTGVPMKAASTISRSTRLSI
jgi:hypothetical protein